MRKITLFNPQQSIRTIHYIYENENEWTIAQENGAVLFDYMNPEPKTFINSDDGFYIPVMKIDRRQITDIEYVCVKLYLPLFRYKYTLYHNRFTRRQFNYNQKQYPKLSNTDKFILQAISNGLDPIEAIKLYKVHNVKLKLNSLLSNPEVLLYLSDYMKTMKKALRDKGINNDKLADIIVKQLDSSDSKDVQWAFDRAYHIMNAPELENKSLSAIEKEKLLPTPEEIRALQMKTIHLIPDFTETT